MKKILTITLILLGVQSSFFATAHAYDTTPKSQDETEMDCIQRIMGSYGEEDGRRIKIQYQALADGENYSTTPKERAHAILLFLKMSSERTREEIKFEKILESQCK